MKFMALDLEMNQPTNTIIQIGACVFELESGQIIAEFSRNIFTNETITPYITELTKITQEDVANGADLRTAYEDLCKFRKKHQANKQTVTWGDGDVRTLKEQAYKAYKTNQDAFKWELGFRFFDTKTLRQIYQAVNSRPMKGGLAASMESLGLVFAGQEHNALADAKNTAMVFCHLANKLKL